MQETCLLIQSTVLRAASLYFHGGLRKCFANDYELLFDSPVSRRLDNTVLGHSPPPHSSRRLMVHGARSLASSPAKVFIIDKKTCVVLF